MYIPKLYENKNMEEVKAFVQAHSFAVLTGQINQKPWATHIPLELEINKAGKEVLQGHISRANELAIAIANGSFQLSSPVLAIFQGPHSYISSSWYDHENVPTWNYIAVHIYGKIKLLEDDEVWEMMRKLVNKYEKNSVKPVSLDTMQKEYVLKEMKGILGFEIEIDEIQAAYKLSQNRDAKNHQAIVEELEKKADPLAREVAAEMKKINADKAKGSAV